MQVLDEVEELLTLLYILDGVFFKRDFEIRILSVGSVFGG